MTFPPVTHVALTVRDLSVSVPWYESLLGAAPVLDEDTDPDFHHTVYIIGGGSFSGCTSTSHLRRRNLSVSTASVSTTSRSAAKAATTWRSGPAG